MRLAAGIVACLAILATSSNASLVVTTTASGVISLSLDGQAWLTSSAPAWLSIGSERLGLQLVASSESSGTSPGLGAYTSRVWSWSAGDSIPGCAVAMTSELRQYASEPNAVVVLQTFPCGVSNITTQPSWLASAWPTFSAAPALDWALFNGEFAKHVGRGVGLDMCNVTDQGGPLILHNNTRVALVVSPLTSIKTAEFSCTGALTLGLKGSLNSIPAGYSASWVMQGGSGFSRTMERWGDTLLRSSGKSRTGLYQDSVVSSLGYWTDNGAYYHYPVSGPTTQPGGYQTEIARVAAANKADRLPFRHWQLDSWWYQKGTGGNGSSRGKGSIGPSLGVYQWVADPFVFPSGGLPAVQEIVELPFVIHNRWFEPDNWYKRNGIPSNASDAWTAPSGGHRQGNWSARGILALDQEAFWSYFFTQQPGYGLRVYEQDFLWTQYEIVPELKTNATLADYWLKSMADAAWANNLTIQYCMPYPREYIASTQHQAVTTIRASDDYAPNNPNWRIARTSLLAHAVGILPFKDTFLSGGSYEAGAANPGPELTPELQTLVSTLSGAMVGPGDGPHMANRTRLMQSCREDGVLLKADRAAFPVDAAWGGSDPGGELSWAPSAVRVVGGGVLAHRYVLAAALERSFELRLGDLELAPSGVFVVRDWYSGALSRLDQSSSVPLKAGVVVEGMPVQFEYLTVCEVRDGWCLLGEIDKYVTASTHRVVSVQASSDGLRVVLKGVVSEQVRLCALQYVSGDVLSGVEPSCESAVMDSAGEGLVVFASQ